ncbi:hypothetical protein SLA2020_072770 [Shorea laevis]
MGSCPLYIFYLMFIIMSCNHNPAPSKKLRHSTYGDTNLAIPNRKLLFHGSCTNRDISIFQSKDITSGIPQYIVQIVNTCVHGCVPSDIHLHCGWFASARIVNPRTFKRVMYDDCLVNGGKPLKTGQTIRFTYSNSFMYPLAFKSAKFC